MIKDGVIRVSTVVAAEPALTFRLFTDQVDRWWRRTPRHRFFAASTSHLRFEVGVAGPASGRLIECCSSNPEQERELGRILAWEPGRRLLFTWRGPNFAPRETTEVEVRFRPIPGGTRVSLEHRGWDAFASDHPALYGMDEPAFRNLQGLFWAELLTALQGQAARSPPG